MRNLRKLLICLVGGYMVLPNAATIAFRNDVFRRSGNGLVITEGIRELPNIGDLLKSVREFNKFDLNNDPYGEHDFGKLSWFGHDIFWKIDYYDQRHEYFEDPLSSNCCRLLTVMRADEY